MGQTNGVRRSVFLLLTCAISVPYASTGHGANPGVKLDCAAKKLVYPGGSTAIPLPSIAKCTDDDVAIGAGKSVTHARAESADGATWEAIVAHELIFEGRTGYVQGQPGGRSGQIVQILPRATGTSYVLVGQTQEDRVICGQKETALAPRVLDPATMQLRGASVQRLPADQRKGATRIEASARRGPAQAPIGQLLAPAGASVGSARAVTDGDVTTVWSEARPGVGQGEFMTFSAPNEVALTGLGVTIAPPTPKPEGAAPRTFFVVTEPKTFEVRMPEDAWQKPGEAYEVNLPEPVHTTCLSIVLDEAYDGGRAAPEVSIAEITAYSSFDGPAATAEQVARALAGGGARSDEAAAVLKRAKGGLAAVRAVYPALDAPGRALAMDVAASAPECAASAPLLVTGLGDADGEVVRKAREKLWRCKRAAAPALADATRDTKAAPRSRSAAAKLLGDVAPHDALAPLAEAAADGDDEVRKAVREGLAHAAKHATREELAALLADRARPIEARLSIVRALAARLADARAEADSAIADLLAEGAPMRTRYLVAGPMADLARGGDETAAARLAQLVTRDPEWPVRARAAEVAGGVRGAEAAVAAAAADPEPRVREAALRAAAAAKMAALGTNAAKRLSDDPWTFVRVAAAATLAALPRSAPADDALAKALTDPAPRVRTAAIGGLAAHGATARADALLARLEDDEEDPEVRVAAARALGQLCARAGLDLLTKLGARGASPVATQDERAVGLASIAAIGRIHPPDLAARIAKTQPKDASYIAKRAAERALAETDVCR
jgi:HEAT repeat protein